MVEDGGRCLQSWRSLVSLNDADMHHVGQAVPRGHDITDDAKDCMYLVLRKAFCDVKLSDAATSSLGNSLVTAVEFTT